MFFPTENAAVLSGKQKNNGAKATVTGTYTLQFTKSYIFLLYLMSDSEGGIITPILYRRELRIYNIVFSY